MKSSRRWARAGWARSTARATPGSGAKSRSRCFPRLSPPTATGWSASSARRTSWPRSTIPTSRRSSASKSRTGPARWSWSWSRARRSRSASPRARSRWTRRCRSREQIAEALEYAHERGIVHRDLKPANVKLTRDGAVKVLDFGLAKALSDDPLSAEVSNSPTLSAVATRAGIILGTAAYMSPEQAKGKAADRRSDIWSFGVVLYEMLTGQRLFSGETSQETLAAVLRAEPDWSVLPASVPARVRRLLRRCLEKDPRRRIQSIGEARIAIEDALGGAADETTARRAVGRTGLAPGAAVGSGRRGVARRWYSCFRAPRPPAPEPATSVRLSVELGADVSLMTGLGPAAILSPDGTLLAFTARKAAGQRPQLYVRRLEQLQASPLAGTEGARNPFFSPDSQWLGFFAEGKLKKVAVTGGAAVTLCDAPDDRGGTWSEDGTIVFTPGEAGGLSRVSSAGGTPEVLTTPDQAAGETSHRWPQALPGGKAVLFTVGAARRFREREHRRAVAAQRPEEGLAARRLPRPLPPQRPHRLHARGDALRRALRPRTAGAHRFAGARARRRHRRPAKRGSAVRFLGPRHAGVPAGTERRGRACRSSGWTRTGRRSPSGRLPATTTTSISLPTAEGSP